MQHLTITIGRNIGDSPMSGQAWAHFQLEAHMLACAYGKPVYEIQGHSHSKYGHEDTLLTCVELDPLEDLAALRESVAALAERYHKQTIAVLVSDPAELVSAATNALVGQWN